MNFTQIGISLLFCLNCFLTTAQTSAETYNYKKTSNTFTTLQKMINDGAYQLALDRLLMLTVKGGDKIRQEDLIKQARTGLRNNKRGINKDTQYDYNNRTLRNLFAEINNLIAKKKYQTAVDLLNQLTVRGGDKIRYDDLMQRAKDGLAGKNYIQDKNERMRQQRYEAVTARYNKQLAIVRRLYKMNKYEATYKAALQLVQIRDTEEAQHCLTMTKKLWDKEQKKVANQPTYELRRVPTQVHKAKSPKSTNKQATPFKYSTLIIQTGNQSNYSLSQSATLFNDNYTYEQYPRIGKNGTIQLQGLPDGYYTIQIHTFSNHPDFAKADMNLPSVSKRFRVVNGRFDKYQMQLIVRK